MRPPHAAITAAQIALAASFVVAGYFLAFDALDYLLSVTAEIYGRFWSVRELLFLHIATGGLALIAGAVQLCLVFFRRTSTAHRWGGRVYVAAVLASSIAALTILRKGSIVGPMWVALLVTLAACALLFTAFGLIEARRRQWRSHSAWMLRSYVAMMVFAWFRLAWELPILHEMPKGSRAAAILGVTMLISFAGTELILTLKSRDLRRVS